MMTLLKSLSEKCSEPDYATKSSLYAYSNSNQPIFLEYPTLLSSQTCTTDLLPLPDTTVWLVGDPTYLTPKDPQPLNSLTHSEPLAFPVHSA